MAAISNEQLESMGLEPPQGANHEFVNYSSWDTKNLMHDAIKASTIQPKKPGVARMWRQAQGSTVVSLVYCNITGVSVSPETGSYKKNLPYLSNG